jgi:hypothetical protein
VHGSAAHVRPEVERSAMVVGWSGRGLRGVLELKPSEDELHGRQRN